MRFISFFAFGVVVAAAIAGCETGDDYDGDDGAGGVGAGPGTPRPMYEAGSRLTPRFVSGGGGAGVFVGFFDNELQTACSFMETYNGELRCLPDNDWVGVALYADGDCTVPAILEPACVAAPYATRFAQDPCHGYEPVQVFRAIEGSPSLPAYDLTASGCYEFPEQPGRELRAAEAVPFSEFVLGTMERANIEGELAVHRVVGADGSSFVQTLLRSEFACEVRAFGSENRCVDVGAAPMEIYEGVGLWAHSTCSGARAAFYGNHECLASGQMPGPLQTKMKPGLAFECTSPDCSTVAYYELDVDIAQVFTNEGNMCIEYVEQALHTAAVGDPFPIEGLPTVEPVEVGTGRLRALAWGHDGKPLIGRAVFRDTTLGIDCTAAVVEGGATRCLPEGTYSNYYADAACTVPLLHGATEASRFLRVEEPAAPPSCTAGVTEVLERGAPHTGVAYYFNDTLGGCEAISNVADLFAGTPRQLTDFAELTTN